MSEVLAPRPAAALLGKTNQHYDQDPRLFQLFLDQRLKYSSGLFQRGATDLDAAQTDKLHFIAQSLDAAPGRRFLDIGCGWGALVLFLAQEYGCETVGITPAPAQAEVVRLRAAQLGLTSKVDVRAGHFEEVAAALDAQCFDGASMVGSIVHFPDKAWALRETRRLLRKGGRVYLSESCFRCESVQKQSEERPGTLFVRDQIFGWGELLPVSKYVSWFEDAGFSLRGLTDLSEDYYRTIEFWRTNVLQRRDEVEAVAPGVAERLVHYFEASNAGWGHTTKHYALAAINAR